MSELGDYIFMSLALSAVLGIIGAVAHPALSREGEVAIGVLCLFSLAAPIVAAIPSLSSLPPMNQGAEVDVNGGYSEVLEEAFGEGAVRYIAEEYSLAASDISVSTEGFDPSSMRAESVTVTLRGRAVLADLGGIRESVMRELVTDGGKCSVEVSFDG